MEEEEKKVADGRKTPLGIERRFDRFGDWLDESRALKKTNAVMKRYPKALLILTWLMRIAVGSVFIVSGLAKGIDPWGSYYKTVEYLVALNLPMAEWGNAILAPVFFLFSFEFIIGLSIMFGCYRKAAPIMAALMMIFMLPLTLWIAISDPVADCGCFGDFIVLSNWATFIKNVLISFAVVWLLKFNTKVGCVIRPSAQWIATVGAAAYIVMVGYIGYWQQPMVDFRPYTIGTVLLADDEEEEYTPHFRFYYQKDGEMQSFGEDDILPDEAEGWKFVKREETGFVKNDAADSSSKAAGDFRIWSEDGEEDVTEMLCGYDRQMMLLVPDINSLSMAESWKINKLYDMATADDMEFFAVVAGSPAAIEQWRDLSSGQYPIYTAEDTSIKELARGNPSFVGLEDGVIIWKTALSALRLDDEGDSSDDIRTSPIGMSTTGVQALWMLSIALLSLLAALCIGSVAPFLTRRIYAKKDKEKDGKAPEC